MHSRVLTPLQGMYRSLQRRFVIAGHFGPSFTATDGIIQGCPLSVLLLNLLMNVWANAVVSNAPGTKPKVYADDAGVTSHTAEGINLALQITARFATVTRQQLNVDKSKGWGTTDACRDAMGTLALDGVKLKAVTSCKTLGAQIRFATGVAKLPRSALLMGLKLRGACGGLHCQCMPEPTYSLAWWAQRLSMVSPREAFPAACCLDSVPP